MCGTAGQVDTHFTSKTRARIPAAIGAALDVPGKCVTQPSPVLVTVTWRNHTQNMLQVRRCCISIHSKKMGACKLFNTNPSLKWISLGGFWKRMQFCSKSSQKSCNTVAATVSAAVFFCHLNTPTQFYSDDNKK